MIPLTHILLPLAMRLGPLDFGQPLWLCALLIFLPIVYLWKTSRIPASPLRRWVGLLLRCALVLAIILSLADTRVIWFNKGICVVFVLDQSQSVPGQARELARERIQSEVEKMTKDDRFAVVEFGGDAVLGSLPSPRGAMPAPAKVADTGRTDIARALRLALASFPEDRQKRIVLFSDGNENSGDALREARIAGVKDVDVDVLLLAAQRGHEVLVDQVIVPPLIRKDAHFVVRAIISADTPQTAQLHVTRDGIPLPDLQTQLKAGTNVVDIPDALSDGGYHDYEVTVVPANPDLDTFAANNTGYAVTQVDAPGKVLLIRGKPSEPPFLYQALLAAHVPVESRTVNELPASVTEFGHYDCVILDNVNRFNLQQAQMTELAKWVHDFGGGLVLIGGDDSFGPGGYKDTPLEEVSPVEMDVKREKHLASLAIVVVLDKSGSMTMPTKDGTHEKMDLANEGAVQVLKLLDPSDLAMIGVVDTEVKWMGDARVIPMTPGNKNLLTSNVRTVKGGGGGIYCETALDHAYRLINAKNVDTMAKHVIMFADAQDSEQQDNCVDMARRNFQSNGVTTSVIGLGLPSDGDVAFQQEVARVGHGRWFITDDAMALPRLFAKEAFMVSRKAYVEKKEGIAPTLYTSPILEGFDRGVPKIYGYVGTTLKPRASLAMHGLEADDPLLADWVIGLGKCVAFTSDSTGNWGKDWVSWNGYSKFWSQVIRWVSKSTITNGLETTVVIQGADGQVIVDKTDSSGRPVNNLSLKANVIAPDQTSSSKIVPLEQVAPGRYQGQFSASHRGTYLVAVADAATNAPLSTSGGVLSYPAEYRDLSPNAALLHALTDATGGQYLTSISGVFQQKSDPVRTFWPLWQILLISVASLFLLDVAWRRLNIADWFTSHLPQGGQGMPVTTRSDASLGAFRTVKTGRRELDTQRTSLRERTEALAESSPPLPLPPEISPPNTTPEGTADQPTPNQPAPTANADYTNRLLSAKKRAKDQIREQSE